MTSNRKAKKMSAMEAHRAVNRQFYRRQEMFIISLGERYK